MFTNTMITKQQSSYIIALLLACKKYSLSQFHKTMIKSLLTRLENKANCLDKSDLFLINQLVLIHEKQIKLAKFELRKKELKADKKRKQIEIIKERLFKYNRYFSVPYAVSIVLLFLFSGVAI